MWLRPYFILIWRKLMELLSGNQIFKKFRRYFAAVTLTLNGCPQNATGLSPSWIVIISQILHFYLIENVEVFVWIPYFCKFFKDIFPHILTFNGFSKNLTVFMYIKNFNVPFVKSALGQVGVYRPLVSKKIHLNLI